VLCYGQTGSGKTYNAYVHIYTHIDNSKYTYYNRYNSCVLCYGQTGSGKTYTAFGPEGALDDDISLEDIPDTTGVVVRCCLQLLQAKEEMAKRGISVSLSAQFVEIYNENVTDLLSGKGVLIKRDSGDLFGAVDVSMDGGIGDVMDILRQGHAKKRFAYIYVCIYFEVY
jgi:hypothetical protein